MEGDIERTPSSFPLFVQIGSYQREKNHSLSIEGLHRALKNEQLPDNTKLVLAGYYNDKDPECVKYYKELIVLADKLNVQKNVEFRRSISDLEKQALYNLATGVLYMQQKDTMSFSPVEAQCFGAPVIACDSPAVQDTCNCPGCFITTDNPVDIAVVMKKCYKQRKYEKELKENAKNYSYDVFCKNIVNDFLKK